jgi:acid phosphatase (class A)
MKKTILCVALLAIVMCANAQKTNHSFLLQTDVPNSLTLLPEPPNEKSAQFLYDQYRYYWGKSLRNTARGEQALLDCDSSPKGMARAFSDAFGTTISEEATPETFRLIALVDDDAGWWGTDNAKLYYKRMRPYMYFGESTCKPEEEKGLSDNGSYPSGHTAGGWAIALILAEINVDNQDAILQRGYSFGESRVICGYHWQSDVDAGYLVASAVVARLHADEAFANQLDKAKKEFAKLKKANKIHLVTGKALPMK